MDDIIQFPRKREIGETITDTMKFIRMEWRPLARYSLIYALPFIIILAALQLVLTSRLMEVQEVLRDLEPELMLQELGGIYKNYFLILIFNVFVQSLYMSIIYSYLHAWLDRGKGNFTPAEITSAFFSNVYVALGTTLVVSFISLIGLLFCIIPGILIANSLSPAIFISIYERKGIGPAIARSWNLVKLQWWGTFALNLIGILIIQITSMVLSAPASIGQESRVLITPGEPLSQIASDWRVWIFFIATVVSILLSVIPYIFLAFQYFNLREREKEERPAIS